MRRNLNNKKARTDAVAAFAEASSAKSLEHMKELVAQFKQRATEFAVKHRTEINRNPKARHAFLNLAKRIGVDPLASSKSMWGDVGLAKFYSDLAIAAFNVCMATRKWNGGLISLKELTGRLLRLRAPAGGGRRRRRRQQQRRQRRRQRRRVRRH